MGRLAQLPNTGVRKTAISATSPGMAAVMITAVVSVGVVWFTVTIAPSALGLVLVVLSFLWGIFRPFDFVVMVLPCLLPIFLVQAPGFGSRSGLLVVLLAVVVGAAIGLDRHKIIRHWYLPRLIVVGWLWILVAEVISGLAAGGAEVFTMIAVRLVRTSIFFMAGLAASRMPNIRKIAAGWLLFGGLASMAAILLQSEYGSVLALQGLSQFDLGSLLGASAIFANMGYLAVASAWGVLNFGMGKSRRWSWFFVALALAFAVSSLYAGRRQVLVALVGSAALFLYSQRGRHRVVYTVLLCLILGASTIVEPVQEFLAGRASVFSEFDESLGSTGYMPIFRAGLHAFINHPLIGVGLGNYSRQTASEGIWASGGSSVGAAPHNALIRVFAETGLMGGIGVVLLLAGIVAVGIKAWRRLWVSSDGRPVALLASGLGGLVIAGVSVTLIDDVGYCFVLGEFIGVCVYMIRDCRARKYDMRAAPGPDAITLSIECGRP